MPARLGRRTLLRGAGAAVGLPMLEAMGGRASAGGRPPRRLAFLYVPNGAHMADWTPAQEGAGFALPPTLAPLGDLGREVLVLSGLAHRMAEAQGDGGGAHASAQATFLTGVHSRRRSVHARVAVSVDQLCARRLGPVTRLASLELSCDRGQQAGACDTGCSCAYQFNLAWKSETLPMPPEVDPRLVFERLFGAGDDGGSRRRRATDRSILDFVLGDLGRLGARVGGADRAKLDEYATALRDLEARLQRTERMPAPAPPAGARPSSIPREYPDHLRLMLDLLALAFQTDATRVATFILAHEGSNRSYPFVGVPDGHHDISHHGGNPALKAKLALVNRFHVGELARFLGRLRAIREAEGTLLDHAMIVYGSGISDGDKHSHFDLPILIAGRGGGTLSPGRHLRHEKYTPASNLFVSLLERMGTPVDRFGDSTGALAGLDAPAAPSPRP